MVINKKIKRTMFENKSRYIGSFILILISCMLFTAFKISLPSVKQSVDKFKIDNNVEDAYFIVQEPLENIEKLEKEYNLILEERKSLDYSFDNSTLRLLRETDKLNKYQVTKGNSLNSNSDMLIFDKYAKEHSLDIGNRLKILGEDFKITGFVAQPDYLYVLNSETDLLFNNKAFGIAVISKDAFTKLNNALTFYSVKFNEQNQKVFKDFINKSNVVIKWIDSDLNPRIDAFNGDISGTMQMGDFLPIMILLVTCFLLAVVMWRLLKGEFIQIGTLYALGYRKGEILRHYLSYSIIISAAGSVLGIIAGLFLVRPLMITQSVQYNLPLIHVDYKIGVLLTAFILPFVFLVPATAFVVRKALKLPPLVLMRGGANGVKIGSFERKLNLNRFKFNTKFKIRELVRNIPRSFIMIFGVALASMLLLLGFIMQYSINNLMSDGYDKVYQYKYTYLFSSLQTQKPEKGEAVSVSTFSTSRKNGETINFKIQGMQQNSQLIDMKDSKGIKLTFKDVIVTKPLADKLGVGENDSINVENRYTGKRFAIKIDKVADAYNGNLVYMPIESYNSLNGFPQESYTGLLSTEKINIEPLKLLTTINKNDVLEGYKSTIGIFRIFTIIITIAACLIGLIIIYIITSLLIEENRANISLLKILGYSRKRIFSLILNSTSGLVILGYIISVPLITVLMDKFFEAITSEMDITIPAKVNVLYVIACFILIYVTYEVSKLLSRKKIINISMADSLKNRVE